MGQTEGGVAHFSGFFTEDGSKQFFFGTEIRLAFGRNLTDQNIFGFNFSADVDNAVFIEIFDSVFPDVGNIAGDFFRAEFGFSRLAFMFLNVNGGVFVFF